MEKIRQKRIPLIRKMMKARFEKVIAMEPKTVREKSLRIFRKVVKEFEIRTKDMKDLVKLIRASSFKDLNGELLSLKTLSLRVSDTKTRTAKMI